MVERVIVPLALAVVLGGLVGLEREFHGRAAGLRTHILVCLATAMAMVGWMELHRHLPAESALRIDPGRIAAGVLTGIGFIGAGAIIKLKSTHRGLTTAACIWMAASLGVVIGVGAYALAVAGTLLALAVLMLLVRLESYLPADAYREVHLVAAAAEGTLERAREAIEGLGLSVHSQEIDLELDEGLVRLVFSVRMRRGRVNEEALVRRLRELPGVRSIGWRHVAG